MLGAIFLANFSKYNANDNIEFLESPVDEYLLIAATEQTVNYSEVFAIRNFKNFRFDMHIGKQ